MFKERGVDATVKFTTALPELVNLSSAGDVVFPMIVRSGSPAMIRPLSLNENNALFLANKHDKHDGSVW